ncbi:unnamed protein product [Prunus armeniaca]
MDIPPEYNTTQTGTICKLQKALYGLKQSPRAWFGWFTVAIKNNGFRHNNSDYTLFLKHQKGKVTTLIIYVDDMIITGNDKHGISQLQDYLAIEFEIKNLDTPIIQNHYLGEYPNQVPTNKERYQRLVGRLIYLSYTRLDIAYAVSVVSQFMHSPSEDNMNAVIRILRFLKSAPGKRLMFSKHGHLIIDGYTDADWAGSIKNRKSTSDYFTIMGGNWLHGEARSRRWSPYPVQKLSLKAAIAIAQNSIQHDRTKHVEVDWHYIKQKLEAKVIQFPFINFKNQLTDILTEAISSKAFHNSLDQLGIGDIYAPTFQRRILGLVLSLAASLCAKPSNKLKWSKAHKFIGLEERVVVWYMDLEGPLDTLKVTEVLGAQKHQNPSPFLLSPVIWVGMREKSHGGTSF